MVGYHSFAGLHRMKILINIPYLSYRNSKVYCNPYMQLPNT